MPKIGVVIPVHNGLRVIERCLTTIHAQTYPVNIYIADDSSTDGTREFLEARPHWYTQMIEIPIRCGWPIALNGAALLAIGDHCDAIFTANADDFLRLDCIEKAVEVWESGKDWVVCNAQQIGAENVVQAATEGATLELLYEWAPLTNYALIPSEMWKAVGGYPTDISLPNSWGYKEDHGFVIAAFRQGYTNYGIVKEPVYYYVMSDGQLHEDGQRRHEEAMTLIRNKYFPEGRP